MTNFVITPPMQWQEMLLDNDDLYDNVNIYVGGTIDGGNSEDWQKDVITRLQKIDDITIFNPRRDDWDERKGLSNQIIWENQHLADSNLILLYFKGGSISPITLLELGSFAKDSEMIVCCEPDYFRYENVTVFCDLNCIPWHNTLEDGLCDIEKTILKQREHLKGIIKL